MNGEGASAMTRESQPTPPEKRAEHDPEMDEWMNAPLGPPMTEQRPEPTLAEQPRSTVCAVCGRSRLARG